MIDQHSPQCAGCSACYAICPQGAISMEPDEEGFLFPAVDQGKCVDCDLCSQVCPIDKPYKNPYQDYFYRAVNANEAEIVNSSSGGVFPILARAVLEKGGHVCGCILDSDLVARHVVSNDKAVIREMSRSKYVQSDMGDCFRQLRHILEAGGQALFSGTPCQVGGLMSYLGKDYPNLLTMDIACKGVPSPAFFRQYVENAKKEFPQLAKIYFRTKKMAGIKAPKCCGWTRKGKF